MLEHDRFLVLENYRFLVLENDRFLVLENDRRPRCTWLRVREVQCAMALRVMVQSHLGWPWECHRSPDTSSGSILDEYAPQD